MVVLKFMLPLLAWAAAVLVIFGVTFQKLAGLQVSGCPGRGLACLPIALCMYPRCMREAMLALIEGHYPVRRLEP